jgi:hypothetical protein
MKLAAAVLLSVAAFVQPALAQDNSAATQAATQAATRAADAWLVLADAGNHAEGWTQGAGALRAAVTQQQWNEAVSAARSPYGAVKSRKLSSANYTRKLPGAPEGEYVVLQYQTEFASKSGVETVVPMREADGSWKVSGYFIQ